jgi:DHA2 family lincomycin resistance protein-like MFS transporter
MEKTDEIKKKIMFVTLLFGGFLSLLNETILNVALSKLMVEMSVDANTVQWLSTGYVLVVAMVVPMSAFLMRTIPTRKLFLGAMGAFFIGTLAAAFAPSFPWLLIARIVQASGTGLLAPLMIAVALAIAPQERQGSAMGICTCVILVGPAAGPVLSGLMVDAFGWRSLFGLLIPLELACILSCLLTFHDVLKCDKPAVDIVSFVLSCAGFAALVFGISKLSSDELAVGTLLLAGATLLLALFARRQNRLSEPMLDVSVFSFSDFMAGAAVVVLVQMVQFAFNVVLPMVYESSFKVGTLSAAIALLPSVAVCAFITPLAGRIFDRRGGRALVVVGLVITAFTLVLVALFSAGLSLWGIAALMAVAYAGIGICWSPNQSFALSGLKEHKRVDGVTILNTCIQLGSALGTPLLVGVMSKAESSSIAEGVSMEASALFGLTLTCLVAAGLVALALLFFLVATRKKTRSIGQPSR